MFAFPTLVDHKDRHKNIVPLFMTDFTHPQSFSLLQKRLVVCLLLELPKDSNLTNEV